LPKRVLLPLLALLVTTLAVAGCGGSGQSSSSNTTPPPAPTSTSTAPAAAGSTVATAADPSGGLTYSPNALTAKAGSVTIKFTNAAPLTHDLTLAKGGSVLGATPRFMGATNSLTVKLAPGTYSFYCTVDGHRAAGMTGTLTVR
jgi:uncharacterized cupredoxin-like copper-binding protein